MRTVMCFEHMTLSRWIQNNFKTHRDFLQPQKFFSAIFGLDAARMRIHSRKELFRTTRNSIWVSATESSYIHRLTTLDGFCSKLDFKKSLQIVYIAIGYFQTLVVLENCSDLYKNSTLSTEINMIWCRHDKF